MQEEKLRLGCRVSTGEGCEAAVTAKTSEACCKKESEI